MKDLKSKLLFTFGILFSIFLCVGAVEFGPVVWNTGGWYGGLGNKNMRTQKIFDNRLIGAGETVSSDWIELKKYSHFGTLSFVADDVGTDTEAATLSYNLSTDPDVNQNGTTTMYTDYGVDTNGNWRDEPIIITTLPYIQFHLTAGVSAINFSLHTSRAD